MITVVNKGNNSGVLSPRELSASQSTGRVSGPLVFAWDHRTNQYVVLNQGFLAEICVLAELYHVLGRVSESTKVTIEGGTKSGTTLSASIEVPAGELWFIRGFKVVPTFAPEETGSCSFNVAVSPTGGTEWNYYSSKQALTEEVAVIVNDDLSVPLRLTAGSKVTLTVSVDDDFINNANIAITVYGTKNRRIV